MPAKTAVKMTAKEVLAELKKLGTEQTKKTFLRHGAKEPFYGVKIGDMKVIQKKIKKDHQLALDLYDTGNSDAMYLAGLIADPEKMTKADLKKWVKGAYWYMISGVSRCRGSRRSRAFGRELALEWIDSDSEMIAIAGLVHVRDASSPSSRTRNSTSPEIEKLLNRVKSRDRQCREPRAVRDEQLRDRGGELRRAADREGEGDGEGHRHGRSGHGRHVVQGAGRRTSTSRRSRRWAASGRSGRPREC